MKKILIILLFLSGYVYGQQDTIKYTPMTAAGYQFKYLKTDSGGLAIPFGDTAIGRGTTRPGSLKCNWSDSGLYMFNGRYWVKIGSSAIGPNSIDSVIRVGCEYRVYQAGNYIPIDVCKMYASSAFNFDSSYTYHYNVFGGFIDSTWNPHDDLYGLGRIHVNQYSSVLHLGSDSVTVSWDSTGFSPGGGTVLDTAFKWSVLDSLSTPPGSPATGDIYEISTLPTGAWVGHPTEIATWDGAAWTYEIPLVGDLLYSVAIDLVSKLSGGVWVRVGKAAIHDGGDAYGHTINIGTNDSQSLNLKTSNTPWASINTTGTVSTVKDMLVNGITVGRGKATGVVSNTVVGSLAGSQLNNTSGAFGTLNTLIGNEAGDSLTTGFSNTVVGSSALHSAKTLISMTAIGAGALKLATSGNNNTAVGANSMDIGINTGQNNTTLGANTLRNNTSGAENVAIGVSAMNSNTTGGSNLAIGSSSLGQNKTGGSNVGIGQSTLGQDTSGSDNVAIGRDALSLLRNGYSNTGIGRFALRNALGIRNTAIGDSALFTLTTGNHNIGIGFYANASTITGTNAIAIGTNASAAPYQFALSDSTTGMKFKNLDSASGTAPSVIGKSGDGLWHVYQTPSAGGGGTVTAVTGTAPINSSGGTAPNITIDNAAADGSTKGAASFTAADFNATTGNISIDYTNGQAASGSVKGFLTSADWTTFNNKGSGTVTSVSGTTDRITSTGGATPVIDISATFEGLLGKVASPLSQFAATTSAQLAGVISDEVGTDKLVFNTSPTLVTPNIGVATATTVNKLTITTPATGSTLTIADGKTLGANNSLTLAGTDGTTQTMPDTSALIATIPKSSSVVTVNDTTVLAGSGKPSQLQVWGRANKKYRVTVSLWTGCDNTGGIIVAFSGPAGSAVLSGQWVGTGITASTTPQVARVIAINTLTGTAFNKVNTNGSVSGVAYITTSATAGPIGIQFRSTTAGQLSTIFTGSTMDIEEVQ